MHSGLLRREVEYLGGSLVIGSYTHECCSCVSWVNSSFFFVPFNHVVLVKKLNEEIFQWRLFAVVCGL